VILANPVRPSAEAVITAFPALIAVTNPLPETTTMVVLELVHEIGRLERGIPDESRVTALS
jgi:hypothetical protein